MPDIDPIKNAPDISFIDNKTPAEIEAEMIADYERYMTEASGKEIKLERASPHRGILISAAAQIFQALNYVDRAGKQNLLKYSYGGFLENLGLLKGVTRNPATAAVATIRFTISAPRTSATGIPAGTRVATADSIYFATDAYAEIPAGGSTVEVTATCTETGATGNGIAVGEINTIVDPAPYIASATNINATNGGAAQESDADLAERIFNAPSGYSTAGPKDAYEYLAKQYNAAIGDVIATSDAEAGRVDIVFIMADGSTPDGTTIAGLKGYLSSDELRPMTDTLTVAAPTEVTYTIKLTYYINRSDSAQAVAIQNAVKQAVADYIKWQRTIGRDINPSELTAAIIRAGAKRVDITAPTYAAVNGTSVAALSGEASLTYGGLEDD